MLEAQDFIFLHLLKGLIDVPTIPQDILNLSEKRWKAEGLQTLVGELDDETRDRIDIQNPMRVMRGMAGGKVHWKINHCMA